MIKNLSQLKKAIGEKREFVIVEHYIKPVCTGQRRKPTTVQTNGFYSVVADDPTNEVSMANGGRGYWLAYGKAKEWEFDGELITSLIGEQKVMTIKFV